MACILLHQDITPRFIWTAAYACLINDQFLPPRLDAARSGVSTSASEVGGARTRRRGGYVRDGVSQSPREKVGRRCHAACLHSVACNHSWQRHVAFTITLSAAAPAPAATRAICRMGKPSALIAGLLTQSQIRYVTFSDRGRTLRWTRSVMTQRSVMVEAGKSAPARLMSRYGLCRRVLAMSVPLWGTEDDLSNCFL